jgi:hypothetical protein
MHEPNDLVVAMLGLAMAAIMLVAGALYLIITPDPIPTRTAGHAGNDPGIVTCRPRGPAENM